MVSPQKNSPVWRGENTLLFGSPQNTLALGEQTTINGTPGVNTLLNTPDLTGFGAAKDHSVFQTPELPAGENTLLFGPPRNGFTPIEDTTLREAPGVDTLLMTPNAIGLGITQHTNRTPNFDTPKTTGADDILVVSWDDLPATTPAPKAMVNSPRKRHLCH
ncbi:hypothetical protein CEP54_008545 [Fusarium duplospermum]|uniref:Uncharacterized protein n=1 Tax=Fusarium duplospermum TaxID=1325734 RepID=A0A428PV97_9HYPO|nr:hypothetical protein CEP54_008545 [Fusarium duplospermum]